MTADTFRTRLLATTMICSAFAAPAFAQTTPAPAQQEVPAAADDQLIVVTGTLIRNPNLVSATPVTVVGEEELNLRQVSVAEDILRQLPGVVPSIGSAVNNGNGGASFVDLRGLGSNRNLVLLDGVRLVPTDSVGRFDLNNVPVALIQRVDALTGGASTTYGADAVAGVVNFITKSDFAGVEIQAQNGITGRGDGNRVRVDVTLGVNTDDGRGNAVISVGYQNFDPVSQGARDVSSVQYDSFNGSVSGSGTSAPSRFTSVNPLGLDNNPAAGQITQGARQVNDAGTAFRPTAAFTPFNFNPFNIFQTPFERYNIYAAGKYEVADNIEVYTRGIYSKNRVQSIIAPSGQFGAPVTINLNNPFLTPALRNAFCNFDTNPGAGFTPRIAPAACAAAAAPGLRPGDADYRTVTTSLFRRAIEVGPRLGNFETSFFDYRLGVRGNITDTIQYDVFGAYGESERSNFQSGYTNDDAARQSLLAVRNANGTISCLDPSRGCVPADFFSGGSGGGISPEAAAFLSVSGRDVFSTSLGQFRATITGDLPISSPFSSSNISFAIGGEYREYTSLSQPDFLTENGLLGGSGGPTPRVEGGYEVYEGVAEVQIPLIEDRPFFKSLTVGGGVRYSAYTVDAPGKPSYDTLTWKAESTWEPVEGFRVRGNYSFASRAPNINELFSPVSTGLTNLADDPCANLDDNGRPLPGRPVPSGVLRDVCIAQGASPGQIGAIQVPTAGQANTTGGGNLALQPEESTSWSVGAIIAPRRIPGLSLSVDYYNIVVTDAITVPTPSDALNSCFNFLSVSNPACLAIGRDPNTGQLSGPPAVTRGLSQSFSNLGRLETDGIDLTVNYRRNFGPVGFAYSFVGNWTNNTKFQATPASTDSRGTIGPRQCVGLYSVNCASIQPEFQWNQRTTLTFGAVDLSVLWRHIDKVRYEFAFDPARDAFIGTLAGGPFVGDSVNFNRVPAYNYFDLSARVNVTENTSLTITVENLTDEAPPLLGNTIGATTFNSGNTYPSTYDALGRRFTVQGRVRF